MAMRLPVLLLGCGLLAACNFPKDDSATVGSKGLWVANGTSVVEYNPAQLGGGTSATAPHVSISSEVIGTPSGVAFDPMGNLWVADPAAMVNGAATPALYEFSAAQLAALATDNSPEPVAVITSTFMQAPRQIVIDTLGNAWIADPTANAVLTYTQAQLTKTDPSTHRLMPYFAMEYATCGANQRSSMLRGGAIMRMCPFEERARCGKHNFEQRKVPRVLI